MKRILIITMLAGLVGCGPSPEERQQDALEEAAERMEEATESGDPAAAMEAFGEAMGQMTGGEGRADPVDFRRLKDLMPEEAAGLRRTSCARSQIRTPGPSRPSSRRTRASRRWGPRRDP